MQDGHNGAERFEHEGLTLVILPDVRHDMDHKRIAVAEVGEAIRLAEATGDVFVEEVTGVRLACRATQAVTFWVEYRSLGSGTYRVESAYYHRMRIHQGE